METLNKRNIGIDILKALSVISVIIYHLYEYKGTYIGVIVFFVISGYFITSVLIEREENYFQFISKRFSKIYPLLTVVLATTILIFFYFNGFLTEKMIYSSVSALLGVSNIYQIQSGLSYFERSGDMFPLLHTWTLSIELQFYIVYPFLIYTLKKIKTSNKVNMTILSLLSLISVFIMQKKWELGYDINNLYYGTDTRIFSLLIGGSFYFKYKDRKEINQKRMNILASISLFWIVLQSLTVDYTRRINYEGLLFMLSGLAGIVVIATVKGNFLSSENKVLKVLAGLGKHSYCYYLWQYPIMVFAEEYFKWSDIKYSYSVAIQILILIVVSEISYICLEARVKVAKILQRIFLLTYLVAIFFLPISEETNSKVIEDMIKEVNIEMQIKELNTEKKNEFMKNIENVDNFEKRLLGIEDIPNQEKIEVTEKTPNEVKNKGDIEEKIDKKEIVIKKEKLEEASIIKKLEEKKEETKFSKVEDEDNKEKKENLKNKTTGKYLDKGKYTFVGDSVMKGAEPFIKDIFINSNVDAKVSRQFTNLPEILKDLKAHKKLNDTVIVHLGTNGVINKESFEKSMELLKGKKVYFMNAVVPKFWEESINKNLKEWSKDYDNVKLIDWHKKAKGKKELFYKDAIHPNKVGAKLYAEFIYENIK